MNCRDRLWIGILILLLLTGVSAAEEKVEKNETTSNASPLIFSFTAATPVHTGEINVTLKTTDQYTKNESIEAYYNNISQETDTSLPHVTFLGIPMECHFCP